MLYFTVSYPTPDGDVIKATYMLTTMPAWALAFGFATERLVRGRFARDRRRPARRRRARQPPLRRLRQPARRPPLTAVLFTCAGQRVDIVSAFGRAGATTIATDLDPLAPALYHADRRAFVPRIDDPQLHPRAGRAGGRARRPADRPAHRPRPGAAGALARRARARARARPGRGGLRADGRQVPRAPVLRGERDPDARAAGFPPTCRTTRATRCSSRCGRGSAPATSSARTTAPSSTSSSATRRSTPSSRSAAAERSSRSISSATSRAGA